MADRVPDGNTTKSIKTIMFDGSNFGDWKFQMETLLDSQGLLECVLSGEDNAEFTSVMKKKAYTMLVLSMAKTQVHLVRAVERNNPHKVWQALLDSYE